VADPTEQTTIETRGLRDELPSIGSRPDYVFVRHGAGRPAVRRINHHRRPAFSRRPCGGGRGGHGRSASTIPIASASDNVDSSISVIGSGLKDTCCAGGLLLHGSPLGAFFGAAGMLRLSGYLDRRVLGGASGRRTKEPRVLVSRLFGPRLLPHMIRILTPAPLS
jgi:hypothetical protein